MTNYRNRQVSLRVTGVTVLNFDNGNTVRFRVVDNMMLVSVNGGSFKRMGADAFADALSLASLMPVMAVGG